jgi:hypothetical protein
MEGDKKKGKKSHGVVGRAEKIPVGTVCRVWK